MKEIKILFSKPLFSDEQTFISGDFDSFFHISNKFETPNTGFFHKKHFYQQHQAEIGKNLDKS